MSESPNAPSGPDRPHYDTSRRKLFYRGQLVKWFDQPAKNQEAILAAFEEEGWPPHIDDPISPVAGMDSVSRLHDAVKNLNRHPAASSLHFRCDGHGQGVVWEDMEEDS